MMVENHGNNTLKNILQVLIVNFIDKHLFSVDIIKYGLLIK